MKKLKEAIEILTALGLPPAQQNQRAALTLLALAQIGPRSRWSDLEQRLLRIVDIMEFMRTRYNKDYAPNTRETVRRQTIHQFEQARLVDRNPDDPSRPTNSGKTVYRLTDAAAAVLRAYGQRDAFKDAIARFVKEFGTLQATYARARNSQRIPLVLPGGRKVLLSPGRHNELQVAIIEELGPRFAPGAAVLYIGDTADKHGILEIETLADLNIVVTEHDKLPDILLYGSDTNWLYLIEAVTSHGPVSPKRRHELESMFQHCTADRIYITAFPTAAEFRRYAADIAWETEVWIADNPEHMIHFNGPKFLGPYP